MMGALGNIGCPMRKRGGRARMPEGVAKDRGGDAHGAGMSLSAMTGLLRPHQWVKNLFILAPLFFTPIALTRPNILATAMGFVAFCALASAVYVLNDYRDREADRLHPRKRLRPLAAGTVRPGAALALAAALFVAGGALAYGLPGRFAQICALYVALNIAYSLFLKRVSILDVLVIAIGFVLRVEAGGQLIAVEPTAWITIMSGLLALFLALAKRRDDLSQSLDTSHRKSLEGYSKPFLDGAVAIVLGALLVAYLVYTTNEAVMARLGSRHLFYTAPFVVAGILRYLQIMLVEERSGAPTLVVLTDRFLIVTILGWVATFAALIYG
jgi:decaprenyl-phosphate phosphoribosyltransferase